MEERKQKKPSSAMETTTLTRVPESERRPWWSLAFIWAGSVICIPALMVGSMVMAGMDFKQSCLCMVIGYVIVVFYDGIIQAHLICCISEQFAPVTVRQSCYISHCVSPPHIFRIVS